MADLPFQPVQQQVEAVKKTLGDLKAIEDQLNKDRSVICAIYNVTDVPLTYGGDDLDSGVLLPPMPSVIDPRKAVAFGAQSSGGALFTGTKGTVWYNAPDGTSFRFHWSVPWGGGNSSDSEVKGAFSVLYTSSTVTGGTDHAHMDFIALQKMPTPFHDIWVRLGGKSGVLKLPTTDLSWTPDAIGAYMTFEGGSIYASPNSGSHEVHGAIGEKWSALGLEAGLLHYPTTDEGSTPDGLGRFNHFQGGSIYWTPGTGAHEVLGEICAKWASEGWETGRLGYPISGETDTPDGKESKFQRGRITWTRATGKTEVITTAEDATRLPPVRIGGTPDSEKAKKQPRWQP